MHELSVAISIVDLAIEEAKKNNASSISEVEINLGTFSGVVRDALEFCFEVACKESIADGAKLTINEIPAKGYCLDCQQEVYPTELYSSCPHCDGYRIDMIEGKELKIKSIVVE